jgi:hypothetical protein
MAVDRQGSRELDFVATDDGVHEFVCDATPIRASSTSAPPDYIAFWPDDGGPGPYATAAGATTGRARDPRALPWSIIGIVVLTIVVLLFVPPLVGLPLLLVSAWYVRRSMR